MNAVRRSLLLLCLTAAVVAAGTALSGQGRNQSNDPANVLTSRDDPSQELVIRERDRDGRVRFAAVRPAARGIRVPRPALAAAEERALAFVDDYGDHFGLGGRTELRLTRRSSDVLGDHVRFAQIHRGVPVAGGELIAHLRGNEVTAVNGAIFARLPESVVPSLTGDEAATAARLVVEDMEPARAAGAQYSSPRLEIWAPEAFGDRQRQPRLAYFVEATGNALRRFIWIDALTGERLFSFSQLTDAKNRSVYTANNTSQLPGTLVRSEGQAATGDTDADLTYDYAGATYDYYKNTHNRDSFDGMGAPLVSTVHYCSPDIQQPCPWNNAFWDGSQMVYATGYATADDVVAHELTHAVTEWSAGLIYYREAGALNESFSDIFGETVDLTDGAGTDTAAVRWNIGEDLPIGAIRNMLTPTLFGDPGKRSDPQFICDLNDNFDHGGVHINSGVPNHAYALAVDGGTYNGRTVLPIGMAKAGRIWYRALTVYLIATSDFRDAYLAISQAATDLIGANGITASDRDQVVAALLAVEMDEPQQSDVCMHLLSPNGGQSRTVGVATTVTWSSSLLDPTGQIYLLLSKDGGQTEYPTPIAVLAPNATSYSWTPGPDHVTGTARLFVGNRVNGEYEAGDWSDATFAVNASSSAPIVTTNAASGPTQSSATLNATINPRGSDTTLMFDYGPTISYGTTVIKGAIGNGVASAAHAFTITGLSCGSTYQFRARAQNGVGTTNGGNQAFTTAACPTTPEPPAVTTGGSSGITTASATVSTTVNPNGASTTLYVDYGPTTSYGGLATFGVVGSGTSAVVQPVTLAPLTCGVLYHYRARAQSSGGVSSGADQTFTTAACPLAPPGIFTKTAPASGAAKQALDAALAWTGSPGATSYEYCVDALNNNVCDGSWTPTAGTGATVNGLTAGLTYWWQVRARSASGTTDANSGLWWSFTTVLPAGTYFVEPFEGSTESWFPQSPWAQTIESAHGGLRAFSDSPGGTYAPNQNASLTSSEIDLRTAIEPRLRFWHRYGLADDGADSWNVWVTTDDGDTYTHLRQFTGTNLAWTESVIDLTPFAGLGTVRLLFQIVSNGSASGDGVYIDDVVVEETPVAPQTAVTVAATDANASEAGPDTGTFTFTRTGPTGAPLVVNFSTTGSATTTTDYADVGWTSVTIPAGQATAAKTVTPSADALVEGAETVVVTLAAGAYTIDAPSSATVTIADATIAGQDLMVSAASAPPAMASPGSTYVITDTTLNQGSSATTVTTSTRFYLSLDTIRNSGDRALSGTHNVLPLAGGASSPASTTVTISTSTAPGTYFQLTCADDTSVAAESNETNNCVASSTTIQITRPDLRVTAVSNPPATALPNGRFAVTDTVLNPSGVWAGTSTVRFYLSLDALKNAGDVLLSGTRSVPALTAGDSSTGSLTVTVPSSTPLQTYRLIACADDTARVTETDETNNCLTASASVAIGLPDLRTTAVSDPAANVAAGDRFTVTDTILNQSGFATAATASTRFYLSLDAAKDASDVLLSGSRSVPILAAGASSTGTVQVTVPSTTPLQTYRLIACADDTARVAETDEANNCAASAGSVLVGIPDLVTTQLVGVPATVLPGAKMTLTDTALNQGNAGAIATTTRYYLSLDAAWSADDVLAGTRSVPLLAAGASSAASRSVTVPSTTPAGAYFVLACADDTKRVVEGNEANNCLASAATVAVGP